MSFDMSIYALQRFILDTSFPPFNTLLLTSLFSSFLAIGCARSTYSDHVINIQALARYGGDQRVIVQSKRMKEVPVIRVNKT